MSKFYWTTNYEDQPRYHTRLSCPVGFRIEFKDRRESDFPRESQIHCKEC
jgi:hypothetical protein